MASITTVVGTAAGNGLIEIRMCGPNRVWIHKKVTVKEAVALTDRMRIIGPAFPFDDMELGDSFTIAVDAPVAEVLSVIDTLVVDDGPPESRVGYARIGFSSIGA